MGSQIEACSLVLKFQHHDSKDVEIQDGGHGEKAQEQ